MTLPPEHNETHLFDHGEDPWFVIIVSVSSNAQVDLLREGILLVACRQLEDATEPQTTKSLIPFPITNEPPPGWPRRWKDSKENVTHLSGGA